MKSVVSESPPNHNGKYLNLTGYPYTEAVCACNYYLSYYYRYDRYEKKHLYFWLIGKENEYQTIEITNTYFNYNLKKND